MTDSPDDARGAPRSERDADPVQRHSHGAPPAERQEELARLRRELSDLAEALEAAEGRYAIEQSRFDRLRDEYPEIVEHEARLLRDAESLRVRIQSIRERIGLLR